MAALVAEAEAANDRVIAQAEALGVHETVAVLRGALRAERTLHATQTDALRVTVSQLQAALAFASQALREAVRQLDPDKDHPPGIKNQIH